MRGLILIRCMLQFPLSSSLVILYPYRRPRQHGCILCFVNLVHVFIACAAAQSLVDSVPRGCALGQVHTSLEVVVSGVLLWFGLHLWLVGPS